MISFLPFIIRYRWAIGGALIALLVAIFFLHYKSVIAENKRLEIELVEANRSIDNLSRLIINREEIRRNEMDALGRIDNAPDSDDGDVAPVLRDAITGLQDNR